MSCWLEANLLLRRNTRRKEELRCWATLDGDAKTEQSFWQIAWHFISGELGGAHCHNVVWSVPCRKASVMPVA